MRDIRFDILKALAILMVVFGHAAFGHGRIGAFMVGMNMPLFFVISGYFATNTIADVGKTARRCLKYLRAMAAYSLLIVVVFYGLDAYDTLFLACKRFLTIPLFCWWFMWSLMLSMVSACAIVYVRHYLPRGWCWTVAACVIIYVAILLLPDSWWQVKYFKFNFPFFLLGVFWRCLPKFDIKSRIGIWCAIFLGAIIFYAIYVAFYQLFPITFYRAEFNFCSIFSGSKALCSYLIRYCVAICGIVSVVCPIMLLRPNRITHVIAELGTTTMGVYFLHQAIIKYFIVPHYSGNQSAVTLVCVAFVLWLGCHTIVFYINQHSFLRKVFN